MKSFFKLLILLIFLSAQSVIAAEYKVLVLPDDLEVKSTNYYIYPEASEIISDDIVNAFNLSEHIEAPTVSDIRNKLNKNYAIKSCAAKGMKRFKYMYNIEYANFRRVADYFGVDYVLLVTSGLDVQNYISRRTLWDFLNIGGATVIDPAYELTTNIVLLDAKKGVVLWQNVYRRGLSACENRMVANSFGPAYEQLNKIKYYSSYLSPMVATEISYKILPAELLPQPEPKTPFWEKFKKEKANDVETVEASDGIQNVDAKILPSQTQTNIEEVKQFKPSKPRLRKENVVIPGGIIPDL